jgi:hypothetical protein
MEWAVIVSAVFLIIASNYLTNRIGESHYREKDEIYDLFHSILPDVSDYEGYYFVIFTIILAVLFLQLTTKNKIEFGLKLLIIWLMRAITISVTILPPHEKCSTPVNDLGSVLNGGCHDKIFSGHTASLALLSIYLVRQKILSTPIAVLLNTVNVASILLTRGHYTVDIVIALFITYFVYEMDV